MELFRKIAIVGVGLIGGSIGLAVKKRKLADEVIGIGHRQESVTRALKVEAIDEGTLDISKISDADLVVLAAPVTEILNILPELNKFVKKDGLIIDVGSTKLEITRLAKKSGLNFIGCHPLAGTEKKGPQNAKAGLFKDSLCVITPSAEVKKENLKKIEIFWQALGAKPKVLDAATHDRIIAFTSHLPHIVVFSLINCIKGPYLKFAAGGLKDTTRIGQSDPLLWRDIFLTNRKELLKAIKDFKKSLNRLEALVYKNQPNKLESYLKEARDKRNGF